MAGNAALRDAAEALARAAVDSSQATSLAAMRDSVDELRHLHSGVDKVLVAVKASAGDAAAHSTSNDAAIARVATAVADLGTTVRRTSRMQRIQWAITNAEVGQFRYYDEDRRQADSKGIAVLCLLAFNRGVGCYVDGTVGGTPDTYYTHSAEQKAAQDAKNAKLVTDFHNALVNQLHGLLGEKPEVRKQDNGKFAIFMPNL